MANPCNSLSYTDLVSDNYCCLSNLLHLLEVGVLDVVGLVVAGLLASGLLAASELITTGLTGCAALLVHLL